MFYVYYNEVVCAMLFTLMRLAQSVPLKMLIDPIVDKVT